MTQTIILGANGKLGSILAQFAHLEGLNWRTQARSGEADIIWSGDFDDPAARQIFRAGATIINMIGLVDGDDATLQAVNVHFVQMLLKHAQDAGVAHVVLVSSAAVYGAQNEGPNRENGPIKPTTPYGVSKAAMEAHARSFGADGPARTILRIGNVAGADALLAAAKRFASDGQPMTLHRLPDGSAPIRSYLGPRDLFDIIRALSRPHADDLRTINMAYPEPVTLEAMLRAYKSHLLPNLDWIDGPLPKGIPPNVTLSTATLQHHVALPQYADPAGDFASQVAAHMKR